MYKLFAICYDLKSPLKNYGPFFEAIKKSQKWWHYLDKTWLVYTNETPEQMAEKLRPHINDNDFFLVIEVRKNSNGWLPKDAWSWINEHAQNP